MKHEKRDEGKTEERDERKHEEEDSQIEMEFGLNSSSEQDLHTFSLALYLLRRTVHKVLMRRVLSDKYRITQEKITHINTAWYWNFSCVILYLLVLVCMIFNRTKAGQYSALWLWAMGLRLWPTSYLRLVFRLVVI